tara:strand:- start:3903 stop:5825 length:1923 start_codon:yes stop_codon:yes gene_type:complete
MNETFLILPKDKLAKYSLLVSKLKTRIVINSKYVICYDREANKVLSKDNQIYIFGDLKARYTSDGVTKIKPNDFKKLFNNTHSSKAEFDGNFCIISQNKNSTKIQIDSRGIFDLFYTNQKKDFIISNSFELVTKFRKLTLNNFSVLHSLISVGKRPPIRDTFFNEISRIDLDQEINIIGNTFKITTKKYLSRKAANEMTHDELMTSFGKSFNNYSKNIDSKQGNKIVMMSSGWDSLMIVYQLVSTYGPKKVKPIIARIRFSKNKVFNNFELFKAKKICKLFKLKLKIIDVNWADYKKYLKIIDPISKKNMLLLSDAFFLHSRLVTEGVKNFKKGTFFAGEISDGSQNFGFSQYCTLLDHENNGYREYADKMMTYLFGPSFLDKINKKTYYKDPVFNLLKTKLNITTEKTPPTSTKKIIENFLESMFLLQQRFPMNVNISPLVKKSTNEKIRKYFRKNYLNNLDYNSKDQIYSLYLYLYQKFHWQGSTVRTMYASANNTNNSMINMFWNKHIQNILSVMPEKFGRGLDIGYIKYPSKNLLSKVIDIVELNRVPHSYLSDFSNYCSDKDIIFNSGFRSYIKSVFKTHNPVSYLDKKYFDILYILKLMRKFNTKSKNITCQESYFIYSLFCLSKLLKDLKINL